MNHKYWKIIYKTLLLCLLLAIFAFGVGNRPAQAGSKIPLTVPANVEWVSTGIWLYSDWVGSEINIKTEGTVITMQGSRYSRSGPAGQPDTSCENMIIDDEITLDCALENAPYGRLIGRVGGVVFDIGDATSFTIPAKGFLYLTVNDYLGTYYDNNGQFTVLIELK